MKTFLLGKTNMQVSRLGFGGIPIQRVSEDEAVAIVRRCLELGINYIDTANAYTTSEERIGKAIQGKRSDVIIATKSHSHTRADIERDLKLSLKRLGTDYIDLYQFHGVSSNETLEQIMAPDGPFAAITEAKKTGAVKHIGFTSHQIDIAKKMVQMDLFETVMFPFNFVTDEAAAELLPLARQHDMGFIAMKPLAGGALSDANLAFKFLFQFPDILPIPGIQAISEIEEIVRLSAAAITEKDKAEMRRVKAALGAQFCRRCDYCQPCSAGLQISNIMTSDTLFKRLPAEHVFHGPFSVQLEKASECIECGDCEERCPFHLPIREIVAQRSKFYQEEKRKFEERAGKGPIR